MRRALLTLLIGALVALVIAAFWTRSYLRTALPIPPGGQSIDIRTGMSLSAVARQLAGTGALPYPLVFVVYGRLTGRAGQLQAGEYSLQPGLTPRSLLDLLISGHVLLHSLTVVEGWTVRDVLRALRAEPALTKSIRADDAEALGTELGFDVPSAEGMFFPDTYRFPRGTTDRELLTQAHAALQTHLQEAWEGRRDGLPLANPYELLILASIIERETALAAERPLIAGVFTRRLKLGMRLQTDPTVIYGIGPAFNGNLTRHDLETDTPFNTYTRAGLPPTPISLPGAAALLAAAHPDGGSALFFVATGGPDGGHRFSDTLAEHNAAVQEYLAVLSRRQDR